MELPGGGSYGFISGGIGDGRFSSSGSSLQGFSSGSSTFGSSSNSQQGFSSSNGRFSSSSSQFGSRTNLQQGGGGTFTEQFMSELTYKKGVYIPFNVSLLSYSPI